MPISHEHQFIFIHIPKTAGSSVITVLQEHCTTLDFNDRNAWPSFFGTARGVDLFRQLRGFSSLNAIVQYPEQHLPARILRELVPEDTWSSYYKFAFVRNPWDLVASTYHFLRQMFRKEPATASGDGDIAFIIASLDFTNYVRARPYFASENGLLPYICDREGNLLVDFVGRVERIDEDFAHICRRIGIDGQLPRINEAPRAHYREYYTAETRDMVAREFARDIEMFGYEF
jgi:hypothetical protein